MGVSSISQLFAFMISQCRAAAKIQLSLMYVACSDAESNVSGCCASIL